MTQDSHTPRTTANAMPFFIRHPHSSLTTFPNFPSLIQPILTFPYHCHRSSYPNHLHTTNNKQPLNRHDLAPYQWKIVIQHNNWCGIYYIHHNMDSKNLWWYSISHAEKKTTHLGPPNMRVPLILIFSPANCTSGFSNDESFRFAFHSCYHHLI